MVRNALRTTLGLAVLTGVCIGCGKPEQPAAAPAADTTQWEPESVDLPDGHSADDGHDHSGHDHAGHAH